MISETCLADMPGWKPENQDARVVDAVCAQTDAICKTIRESSERMTSLQMATDAGISKLREEIKAGKSFEFTVKRNNNGLIESVIARPATTTTGE